MVKIGDIFKKKYLITQGPPSPFCFLSSKISLIFPSFFIRKKEIKVDLIFLRNPHVTQGVSLNPNFKLSPLPCAEMQKDYFWPSIVILIATFWICPEMSGILDSRIPTYCKSALVLKQKINEKLWSKFVRKCYWKKFWRKFYTEVVTISYTQNCQSQGMKQRFHNSRNIITSSYW